MGVESSASDRVPARDRVVGLTRLVRDVNPYVTDVLLAMVLTAAAVATVIARPGADNDFRSDDFLGAILIVLQTAPLAVRRVAPLGVSVAINVALVAYAALGYEVVQAGTFSSLVALYGAASLTDDRRGIIAAAFTVAATIAFFATDRGDWGVLDMATISGTWAIAWLGGTFIRRRGEQVEAAGARATRLELERDTLAREAVAEERVRMARELHDIVGHALNIIVIQAAGAGRVLDARPDVSREALASIESTGREALSEMERMLGVLDAGPAARGATSPQPGLAQLDVLAAHVSDAGLPVDVVLEGDPVDVPASVELSAYRIVQESLTNCLKHSGATRATVTVRYRPTELEVEVVDNGRGSADRTDNMSIGGRGHHGMRERVSMFGGEISMGPLPSAGGYRVWGRLPFRSRTPE